MLPSFMNKRRVPRRPVEDQSTIQRVRLVECSRAMMHLLDLTGMVEGYVGDELLLRFGEIVVQIPPEWVEPVGK